VKIFIRFLSFTGLYCLNSHAPVEVGILLIFCIRDTDTYPIFVSIFIIFNYGHNSETLWGHCYELSNFLMVQICLETSLDESQGTIMYIGCRYNYIRGNCVFTPVLNSNCDFTPTFFDFAFLPLLFANEHSFYPYSVNSS